MTGEHRITFKPVGERPPERPCGPRLVQWRAVCSCGWTSPDRDSKVEASLDANAHVPPGPEPEPIAA